MIRVTIDLIPHGDESKRETLHVVQIGKLGQEPWCPGVYHYGCRVDRTPIPTVVIHNRKKHIFTLLRGVFIMLAAQPEYKRWKK